MVWLVLVALLLLAVVLLAFGIWQVMSWLYAGRRASSGVSPVDSAAPKAAASNAAAPNAAAPTAPRPGGPTDDRDEVTIVTLRPIILSDSASNHEKMPEHDTGLGGVNVRTHDPEAVAPAEAGGGPFLLVSAVGQSHPGKKRGRNEDSFLVLHGHRIFAIADGMGGHRGGEVASQLALDTMASAYETGEFVGAPVPGLSGGGLRLAASIQMANRAVYAMADTTADLQGMGTTVVAAGFSSRRERVYVAHAGDSRAYRYRQGAIERLTRDHTLGEEGIPGPLAAHLSRAVGVEDRVDVDVSLVAPRVGDRYLLCSDGLTKMVSDDGIAAILADNDPLETAVNRLVTAANEAGGRDNVTVILVEVVAAQPREVDA